MMKTRNSRANRLLAMLLSAVMVIALFPATKLHASAAEISTDGNIYYVNEDFSTDATLGTSSVTDQWYAASGSIANGALTGKSPKYKLSSALAGDYEIEFDYQITGGNFYFKVSSAGTQATSSINICFTGADSNSDRVLLHNGTTTTTVWYKNICSTSDNSNKQHHVKIAVDSNANTYRLYLDGCLVSATFNDSSVTDLGCWAVDISPSMFFFDDSNGTGKEVTLDNVKIYTEAFSVNQQATLADNIQMTFSGSAVASTGIASVKATLGSTEVTAEVSDEAYSVTLPVAAAQMGETIALTGLDSNGSAVITRTYTVEAYLNAVSELSTTSEALKSLISHTLSYGSAAAAYFGKTDVTAPDVTLTEVPAIAKAGGINVNHGSAYHDLYYARSEALTDTYTVEFTYQLDSGNRSNVNIGGMDSSSVNAQLYITGGTEGTPDRALVYYGGTSTTVYFADRAVGGKHTIKVTVDCTSQTYQLWMDGTLVAIDTDGDTATEAVSSLPCMTKGTATNTCQLKNVKFFQDSNATINLYSFALYNNDGTGEATYTDDFSSFSCVTSSSSASDSTTPWVNNGNCTITLLARNPLASTFSGENVAAACLSANMMFENQARIRYKLQLDDLSKYTVQINGTAVAEENIVQSGSCYYVYSDGLNPGEYGTDQVLTVTDGTDTITVTYCALEYISRMYSKDTTNDDLKPLLQAMYNYYLVASSYTGE